MKKFIFILALSVIFTALPYASADDMTMTPLSNRILPGA